MQLTVNGQPREVPGEVTLEELISSIQAPRAGRGLAVAIDGEVVPRGAWERTRLTEGSQVEIVAAVQGG
jgi:sulfur carrier protein